MIRGVNFGGWLILEPWMTPHMFPSIEDYDETRLSNELEPRALETLLESHYRSWIQREDFFRAKDLGLNLVRLPYPWWVFGDVEPYRGSIDYVDAAMGWAHDAGIDVMLDLHTAPGCQNGFDNGGIRGVVDWPKDPANLSKTIEILARMADRYAGHPALHSFGILNEPINSIDLDMVKGFYLDAEKALRPILADLPFVYHDSFRAEAWGDFFRKNRFGSYYLDAHIYQCFMDEDKQATLDQHLAKSIVGRKAYLDVLKKDHRIIVGEWSLGLPDLALEGLDDAGRHAALKGYAAAQLLGMRDCDGWIFWSWKVADRESGWHYDELSRRGVFDARSIGCGSDFGIRGRGQSAS